MKRRYLATAITFTDLLDALIEVIKWIGPDVHWFVGSDGTVCIYSTDGDELYQIEPEVDPFCSTQPIVEETNNKNGGK